jgi:hypothetical protein
MNIVVGDREEEALERAHAWPSSSGASGALEGLRVPSFSRMARRFSTATR